ncbi:MAG TPA: acyl-CoA dehydrogenase family protein [Streptosporangiaceae bacterium]|jgi:alkylation response protein AidB-like acyl-CoA dehydrogenase
MDLALSESEQLLKDAARQFVRQKAGWPVLTGLDDTAAGDPGRNGAGPDDAGPGESAGPWRPEWLATFAAAGWLGVFVPEALGGAGASVTDAAVLLEELGRGPVPSPLLASSVVAALLLRAAPPGAGRDELLGGIAAGTHVVIPALREPAASWRGAGAAAAQLSAGGRLSCTKLFASFAGSATHFLASLAPDAGGRGRLAVVPAASPDVAARLLPGFLHASYEVTFDDAAVAEVLTLDGGAALDAALAPGLVAVAAYQAGGCAAVLDMSVDWSNRREQFGMPVGRFQRVQDHIVRIVNAADAARWTAYEAAWALDSGQPAAAARAHLAAAVASESYLEAANAGHEVHAGIGSDPKFGLTLYTRQSRTLYEFLGSPDWHRDRMADGLGWAS